jgi:hypothetical protein
MFRVQSPRLASLAFLFRSKVQEDIMNHMNIDANCGSVPFSGNDKDIERKAASGINLAWAAGNE